ncbi:MAG: hypothetical protein H7Y31_08960 [Chitinophagaceae bacterium]|nr:hypothetical protein [Chitinophagaceae bacterium]
MKVFLRGLYYSFPVQLILLHFKKFQVLLIFWYILFSTVNGNFMKSYGADSLFLAPEYLGQVNAAAAAIVGSAIGIFIMSWNITTFILFSRHFRFLATSSNPFLKYCINNFGIPLVFLVFYFARAIHFNYTKELHAPGQITLQLLGLLVGLILTIALSFLYFFRYDKRILRALTPIISNPQLFKSQFKKGETRLNDSRLIKVEWFLHSPFTLKKVRDVSHYSKEFIETIFSRHHFAAVVSIFIAFVFLVLVGFMLDNPYFQLPAAAAITVFFAILIAVSGAFSYFLQTWSIPFLVLLFVFLNVLYKNDIIDASNKAYGLNYLNKTERPIYSKESLHELASAENMERDQKNMISILDAWKVKQNEARPLLFIINTSGGGSRSATFTMNVLQRLDSITGGKIMQKTFLITGASGGMLGATYFRELDRMRQTNATINPCDQRYVDDIAGDLLNPLFSSFVARDLASPAQKFSVGEYEYIKDRGYAFEEKLNANTHGILNKQLGEWYDDEKAARIPLVIFNSVITRDGRKLIIGTQPTSFLMKPLVDTTTMGDVDADGLDYQGFFKKQNPMNLRLLTAMRMNATFPYVLPNVWLPSQPVIDVMDAGLRDNFGQETAMRFVQVFNQWIKENTSGVVMLQIRDRKVGGWEFPYEVHNITEIATRPMLLLQYNWYKMQEYSQNDMLSLAEQATGNNIFKYTFQYSPKKDDARAALSFHLTKGERKDIAEALDADVNAAALTQLQKLIETKRGLPLTSRE